MKNKVIWLGLSLLLVTAMLLASCAKSTTTSTSISTSTSTKTTTTTTTKTTTSTTQPTTATTTTTPATGNWWDKLGIPQYGGTMVISSSYDLVNFDPYFSASTVSIASAWMERLSGDNWTLDPAIFSYNINFRPDDYVKGLLAESFEFTDPSTFVVHLRHGIHWQNIPPVNGREFTSADAVYHFQREYGLGSGMTPSPFLNTSPMAINLISVSAPDTYTVVLKWKISNQELILETVEALGSEHYMEAREAVVQWGDLNDWHHAIGTGPFILSDLVSGSSATLIKNPNYWGYDERYPQNQLPYIDAMKILVIPDSSTALAAVRTGKIDAIDNVSLQNAQSFQKTNPEILQLPVPLGSALTVDPRNDAVPFKDIRVRQAMQLAINLPEIAANYYGGTTLPYPVSLTSYYMTGWGFPYLQWPQDLKDQYAFNPTAAKTLLTAAGYSTGFNTNCVADSSGDLTLLQIIKAYFANVGIIMDVRTMDAASWTTFVRTQKKYDQLAYRSSGALGMSYEPTRQFGRYSSTSISNYNMVADPFIETTLTKSVAANSVDVIKQLLKDENDFIARQHFTLSLLIPNLFCLYQPWLKNFSDQNFSISGGSSGPLTLGFYASRFWIDQKLKKSMGH